MRRFVPEQWGGTESVVYHVSRELARCQIASPVHCTAMFSAPGPDVLRDVCVYRHAYCFPWLGLSKEDRRALQLKGGSPLSLQLFRGVMREQGVSIIHTHVQHRLGGMARTAARLKGIPYVVSLHGGYFTLPKHQIDSMTAPFKGRLEWGRVFGALFGSRRVLADADGIICVGRDEYEQVRSRYPTKPVFHVPNGVDVPFFSSAEGSSFRKVYGFNERERIVLCVSRIDPQKNQLGLIRAFARFSETHPDHRLVLLGPVAVERYRDEILSAIKRRGLTKKVHMIEGLLPDDPILPSAYKAAEFFVLASVHEPFGIVLLEAWAAGLPVLANRIGGIPGFAVDGETALLVEPGQEDPLVEGMTQLADDPDLRDTLSRRALKVVQERYDWPVVVEQLCDIYKQLIETS